MSSQSYIPPPKTAKELKKLVLEAIQKAPDYANPESFHALYDHLERGLSTDDVVHALERNWELKRSKFNRDEWQWKYEIESESVDGEPITIIIAVDSERKEFTVITRWRDSE
jgi:hypothetical protein